MPGFRPGIREQQEQPAEALIRQPGQQLAGIFRIDPHVATGLIGKMTKQAGNTVEEDLAADEADLRMCRGLCRQMLAATKADFEPDIVDRLRKERSRIERLLGSRESDGQ